MNYYWIAVIAILYLVFTTIRKSKKKNKETSTSELNIQIDEPVNFGYKIVWFAIKSDNKEKIAELLNIKQTSKSNWEKGIEKAYSDGVFITPQVGEWTLAVGMGLPLGDSQESIEKLEKVLNELSSEFGEAQFFGTHRVVEYHNWMKSVDGKIERIYSYVGESMENIKVYGKPTEPESNLNLFNSLSEEAKSDEYYDREDLDYADEELVMKIAENWSVNPSKLTKRTDIKIELGIIGK
jgi:hypothetical protein